VDPLKRVRSICRELAESHEVAAWGVPTFRVRNKIFATYSVDNTRNGVAGPEVWVKSTHVNQDLLVRENPARYFVPPYVGVSGWIGIYLDKRPNWKMIAEILRDGYLLTAPKRLISRK
jgi:predicted DNA-binding protein (MmcQ/YjbR family)